MIYGNEMAKNIIEKAPFKYQEIPFMEMYDREYRHYKEVDDKGQYLYWDKFKWRVKKGDDPKKAWWATKLARDTKRKIIPLVDKHFEDFSFCVPDDLDAKLYKILKLSNQGIAPHDSIKGQYLISSLVMEEAISSSQLEGASTTRRVAKEILASNRTPKNEDEMMIINNYSLMKELKRVQNEELTIDMILDFHRIATRGNNTNGNIAGELRKNNEISITDGIEDNILHQPPSFDELPERLRVLCDFANNEHSGENNTIFINPIIKAIILHFMIGYEHPFPDGNGRTARAIFYWFMLKNGFEYFEYISISTLLKEAPKQYSMSYLYSEIDDNDLTYFVYYQVNIILRAIDELLKYLEKKSTEYEEVSEVLKGSNLSEELNFIQKDIVKKAIKNPGRVFTANEISIDYDIAINTARAYLNKLLKYRILSDYKDGRTKAYIAPANLHDILKVK